jgi:hypothetical protein
MHVKSWDILVDVGPIICFKANVGGEACNCRFNICFTMYGV